MISFWKSYFHFKKSCIVPRFLDIYLPIFHYQTAFLRFEKLYPGVMSHFIIEYKRLKQQPDTHVYIYPNLKTNYIHRRTVISRKLLRAKLNELNDFLQFMTLFVENRSWHEIMAQNQSLYPCLYCQFGNFFI